MRCTLTVTSKRRILCVFPAYTPSFGTFSHAYPLMGGVKAFMPPQGLLLIAAYMPEAWECRFIDENIRRAGPADFAWADAVFVSGMHIQEPQIHDIRDRARAALPRSGAAASGAPLLLRVPSSRCLSLRSASRTAGSCCLHDNHRDAFPTIYPPGVQIDRMGE